jgi:hypothetical protein
LITGSIKDARKNVETLLDNFYKTIETSLIPEKDITIITQLSRNNIQAL